MDDNNSDKKKGASKTKANRRKVLVPSSEFASNMEQDLFHDELQMFAMGPQAKEGGHHERYTNLTGLYSQLPKRVTRKPARGSIFQRKIVDKDRGKERVVEIEVKPTRVMDRVKNKETGEYEQIAVDRYPMVIEERIEKAMIWLASQGNMNTRPESKILEIRFTLQSIKRTIKRFFHKNYSIEQIKRGLEVLANAPMNIRVDDGESTIKLFDTRISKLTLTSKSDIEADPNTTCVCQLHPLLAKDVFDGNYIVHDLEWQGNLNSTLAEDIFKVLSFRYRNANESNTYTFAAKSMMNNYSDGFYEENPSKSWAALTAALDDLKKNDMIADWKERVKYESRDLAKRGRPKIEDKVIIVIPSKAFIKMMKFSHYAKNFAFQQLSNEGFNKALEAEEDMAQEQGMLFEGDYQVEPDDG